MPPNGTAGLARSAVRGISRLPSPPARTMASTLLPGHAVRSRYPAITRDTLVSAVRVDLLTREYPPEVYGGAGVHVEYLARELRELAEVRVHCFGAPRDEAGVTATATRPASPAPTPRCGRWAST